MAREKFEDIRFSDDHLEVINRVNAVLTDFTEQGFKLTLRGLYYQLVGQDFIPNTPQSYERLGGIVSRGRQAGLIDWSHLRDTLREIDVPASWDSPAEIMETVARQYRRNPWDAQPHHVELWVEKDAVTPMCEPAVKKWRLPLLACRGYLSQTAAYDAGQRFAEIKERGQIPIVLHLGDHDPSGIDMTRDNRERAELFTRNEVEVVRLALSRAQVNRYRLPPNPVKKTDGRWRAYAEQHNTESSWELDALRPDVLDRIITTGVQQFLDVDAWNEVLAEERVERAQLRRVVERWEDVAALVGDEPEEADD